MKPFLVLSVILAALSAQSQTSPAKDHPPLVVGPVHLTCVSAPCSAATVTGSALGSGVNGPATPRRE
jgi:hypothetical protein